MPPLVLVTGPERVIADRAVDATLDAVRSLDPQVEVIRLSELGTRAPTRVRLRALGENVQVDPELLTRLQRAGLAPHQELTVSRDGDDVVLEGASGDSVTVDLDHAHAIQVELLP